MLNQAAKGIEAEDFEARLGGVGARRCNTETWRMEVRTLECLAGKTPLIDYTGGGSIKEWAKTLDGALKQDFDTVIPGHGDVTDKAGLQTYRANLEKLSNRAAELVRKGASEADFRKVMETEYGWTANTMQAQWSIPGMMAELKTN